MCVHKAEEVLVLIGLISENPLDRGSRRDSKIDPRHFLAKCRNADAGEHQ